MCFPLHPTAQFPAYVLPDDRLAHNLLATSPLLGAHGRAVYRPTSVEIFSSDSAPRPFLTGSKTPTEHVWHLDLPPPSPTPAAGDPPESAVFPPAHTPGSAGAVLCAPAVAPFPAPLPSPSSSHWLVSAGVPPLAHLYPPLAVATVPHIHNLADASFVAYQHRAFGSPPLSSFLQAIRRGAFPHLPRLTARLVQQNPPLSPFTSFGHLDLISQFLRPSSKSSPAPALGHLRPLCPAAPPDGCLARADAPVVHARSIPRAEWLAADLTGRFPVRSRAGNEYVLVTALHGYIHVEAMPSRTAAAYVAAFSRAFRFFRTRGFPVRALVTDNERSSTLTSFFQSQSPPPAVQYVPPYNHRANPAERHIRSFKNHFLSILSSVHPHFPSDLWDRLLPHAELTLNHLRVWALDPAVSAFAGLHGAPLDFSAHPLHPPGQLVVAHDSPLTRSSWGPHGRRGFYLGPSLDHYRCSAVYMVGTGAVRDCDTLAHFPNPLFHFAALPDSPPSPAVPDPRPDPKVDGSDLVGRWFEDPDLGRCQVTGKGPPHRLLPGAGNRASGPRLAPGFHHTLRYSTPSGSVETSSVAEVADWLARFPALPPPQSAPPSPASPPPAHRYPTRSRARPPAAAACPGGVEGRDDADEPGLSSDSYGLSNASSAAAPLHRPAPPPLSSASCGLSHPPAPVSPAPPSLSRPDSCGLSNPAGAAPPSLPPLNLDDRGRQLRFSSAIAGPHSDEWKRAAGDDLRMLFVSSQCLVPTLSPASSPTYLKQVVREKYEEDFTSVNRRVRGTAGGDRISVPYCCSTATAGMPVVKILLNAVVSENAFFGVVDVAKFYYGADLPPWDIPSIRIPLDPHIYPPSLLEECGITPFLQKDKAGRPFVYADVRKCIPGLPQSGLLSQLRLIAHLNSHGYYETSTPMLFRHTSRPISFTLVVDDFGVKYLHRSDFDHLLSSLQELYSCTSSPVATRYLGIELSHDRPARTMRLSMPGYVEHLVASTCPDGPPPPAKSPSIYTPPRLWGTRPPIRPIRFLPPRLPC